MTRRSRMAQPSLEEQYWLKWTHSRDPHAGNMLVRKYMSLVHYHVQRILIGIPKSVSKEDLFSLGLTGLYDALEKFDYKRDLKFDTYASFRVRGAIIDGLRKEDWLSRGARERAKKIESKIEELEQEYLRTVVPKEIAASLDVTEEEVLQTMNEGFFANILSMDEYMKESEDKEQQTYSIRDDKAVLPEEELLKEEMYENLAKVIEGLNEKEQLVVSLFYKEDLTFTEIGHVMSLSTSRISQIHSKALYKMRHMLTKIMEQA